MRPPFWNIIELKLIISEIDPTEEDKMETATDTVTDANNGDGEGGGGQIEDKKTKEKYNW